MEGGGRTLVGVIGAGRLDQAIARTVLRAGQDGPSFVMSTAR